MMTFLFGGCATAPPCPPTPPPAPVVAAVSPLPACPRESSTDARIAERDRLIGELRQLRESLALLPSERSSILGADALAFVVRLRTMIAELRALDAAPDAPVPDDLSMLAALRRAREPIARELEEARARGWGDGHPRIKALVAQRELAARRFAAQAETERKEASQLDVTLSGGSSPRKSDTAGAVARALGDRFASPDFTLERVASFDPISLRLLAVESVRLDAEASSLSQTYGPRHPVMLALESRRIELTDRFRAETRVLRALIEATSARPQQASMRSALATGDEREERARELADQIALLSIRMADTGTADGPDRQGLASPCVMGAR